MKEKYATTDMRKHQNRMSFGVQEEETADGKGLDILIFIALVAITTHATPTQTRAELPLRFVSL